MNKSSTIAVPFFNEEQVIEKLYNELDIVIKNLSKQRYTPALLMMEELIKQVFY